MVSIKDVVNTFNILSMAKCGAFYHKGALACLEKKQKEPNIF
jgi:hypothetical protein